MSPELQLLPTQASTIAAEVDALYFFLIGISVVFSVLIFGAIFVFAILFRRKSDDEIPVQIHGSNLLEITWSTIPLLLCIVMFVWGADLVFRFARPPADASVMEYFVTGKQWMWKIQHPDGTREINELHVPVGVPVKLTMTSEDVLHAFYIPAFRVKKDVVPGRYTSLWFEATKTGSYHLFCAEYCGTKHSGMVGQVVVLEPRDYESWLQGGVASESPADAGRKLFSNLGCITCHSGISGARGPSLAGVFGDSQVLESGETITVDDTYVRESILNPMAKVVKGFQPLMPTYQGQIDELGIMRLTAYIKSLSVETDGEAAP